MTLSNDQAFKTFQYIIYSCEAMNILRQQWGQPLVTCVSQAELDLALDQIVVETDYTFFFFDPDYYHKNGKMQQQSQSVTSRLGAKTWQVKSNQVSLSQYSFLDSIIYNAPFSDGQQISTFSTGLNSLEFGPLTNSTTLGSLGYLNMVLIQD